MPEKVLIVDDDVDTLRLVGLMLQRQGYQIVAANNGHQALAMAQSESPDIILLDIMMPDLDGYEVTRRLRANPDTARIPIIMFTAKSQVDDKITGFEVGADDYLTKPTQPRELFAHVKAVLARSSKSKSNAAPPKERGQVIGVLAAKGGLGISTLVVNLGIVLHNRAEKEVIVAEYRPGEGSIGLDLGYTRPDGLNRLLQKKGKLSSAEVDKELLIHSSGIRLLPSSYQPKDAGLICEVEAFESITQHLAFEAGIVLLDLGPAISPAADKVLQHCDSVLVVLEPIPYSVQRTRALMEDLTEKGFGEGRIQVVLINRIRTELQLSWSQVQEQVGHSLAVAFTPAPEIVYQASKNNIPVVLQQPDSLITQQFTKLADTINKTVRQKVV